LITELGRMTPNGSNFLEIGIGGSECSLVAKELGYNVLGLDIKITFLKAAFLNYLK